MKSLNRIWIMWVILFPCFIFPYQSDKSISRDDEMLANAADETYSNCIKAINAGKIKLTQAKGETEMPSQCFADPIKALKPLRVYLHYVNMVIVQRIDNGVEEGKYIMLLVSSHLPQNGLDGFEFMPNPQADGKFYNAGRVLKYKKSRVK